MRALGRPRARRRVPLPLTIGLSVTLVAGFVLSIGRHAPRPPVAPRLAIRAALRDPQVARDLRGSHWNRVSASPLDAQLERVSFWGGSRIDLQVAMDRTGKVVQEGDYRTERVPYGDWIAYQPFVLVGLSVLFLLMTLVSPWRRMRNLDSLAALSLVASVVLFQRRYLDASLLAAAPGLTYLMLRLAWRALGPAPPRPPSTPLLHVLTPRLDPALRVRWLRVTLFALALVFAMVGVSSPDALDVAYAVMEGATTLLHGMLPYGHMPAGILHGDTYPILSYVLYTPLALLAPVRSLWDPVDGALAVAVAAALSCAFAVYRYTVGPRAARAQRRSAEAQEAGLCAALAVLTFPAVLITASTGTTDVVLAAMLAFALLLWRRPAAASGMLAVTGWFKLAPFALVPVFLASLRGRRLAAAVGAIAFVSVLPIALLVALGGARGPAEMIHAVSYQFTRGSLQSLWSVLGIESLQPLAQAGVLGLIAAVTVQLWRQPARAADPVRMAAASGAILISLQLAADYWAFLYVVWIVPLLCVSLLESRVCAARELATIRPEIVVGIGEALTA